MKCQWIVVLYQSLSNFKYKRDVIKINNNNIIKLIKQKKNI